MASKFITIENTVKAFIADIKAKKPKPIYFLFGENDFYIDKISDAVEHHILEESEKSFNQSILYGKDVDIFQVISTAARYPMMAPFQVVIVKEAQQMGGMLGEKGKDRFLKYVESPNKQTVLVVLYKNKKLNGNTKLAKALKTQAVYFESPKLADWEVDKWIIHHLRQRGYQIGSLEANMIAENVGNDMTRIHNEIKKMTEAIGDQKSISVEHIDKYIGASKAYNVFELQNAILKGDFTKCMKITNYFCTNPKDFSIQAFSGSFYRMMGQLLITVKYKSESPQAIAARTRMNPFIIKEIYIPARRFYSVRDVLRGFKLLAQLDRMSKGIETVGMSDGEKLKNFLVKFMSKS